MTDLESQVVLFDFGNLESDGHSVVDEVSAAVHQHLDDGLSCVVDPSQLRPRDHVLHVVAVDSRSRAHRQDQNVFISLHDKVPSARARSKSFSCWLDFTVGRLNVRDTVGELQVSTHLGPNSNSSAVCLSSRLGSSLQEICIDRTRDGLMDDRLTLISGPPPRPSPAKPNARSFTACRMATSVCGTRCKI